MRKRPKKEGKPGHKLQSQWILFHLFFERNLGSAAYNFRGLRLPVCASPLDFIDFSRVLFFGEGKREENLHLSPVSISSKRTEKSREKKMCNS
jgi:hypothetical protein